MANNNINVRKTTEAQLIDRAIKDPAFRQELLADPKAVFKRELGLDMPDNIDVEVREETPTEVYLVLPPAASSVGSELSDTELESVSGGWTEETANCPNMGSCGQASCVPSCA